MCIRDRSPAARAQLPAPSSCAPQIGVEQGDAVLLDLDAPPLRLVSGCGEGDVVGSGRDVRLEASVLRVQRLVAGIDLDLRVQPRPLERSDEATNLPAR